MKTTLRMKAIARFVALASVGAALSGCVYDVGLGYASDGYYDDAYGCDPYSGYDRYYDCDYGHGFNNIGYGGGWFDNYWYPGYGFFLFDNIGRRYPMRDHHRRYWGEKRHNWYHENRRRAGDGGRFERRNRGYIGGASGSLERQGGRIRGADDVQRPRDGRREGRRMRNDQWRGEQATGRPDFGRRDPAGVGTNGNSVRAPRASQETGARQNVSAPPTMRVHRREQSEPAPRRGRDTGENVRDP